MCILSIFLFTSSALARPSATTAPSSSNTATQGSPLRTLRVGPINQESVQTLINALPTSGDVVLAMDGPGGDVSALYQLLSGLETWKRRVGGRISCVVTEEAASANAFAFESAQCERRIMRGGAKLMFHRNRLTIIDMTAPEIREALPWVEQRQRMMLSILAIRTGLTVDELEKRIDGAPAGEWWMSSNGAIALGLTDAVVVVP